MLKSLDIVNYALIDKIQIEFDKQLNIITGETGAGKSILIGALGIVLGNRAESKHILNKGKKTIVEAIFSDYDPTIDEILTRESLDIENELVLRREVNTSGKSRAFVNDTPVPLTILQFLASHLIDLNRQHEIRDIVEKEFHFKMVDALANLTELVSKYKAEYKILQSKKSELDKLITKTREEQKERDFILYQFNELEQLDLKEGEVEFLDKTIKTAQKSEDIKNTFDLSTDVLSEGENAIDNALIQLSQSWKSVQDLHPSYKDIYNQLLSVQEEIRDLSNNIDLAKDKNHISIDNLEEKEERLNQINKLLFKHQLNDEKSLLDLMNVFSSKISTSDDDENQIKKLEFEIGSIENKLFKSATSISKKRKNVFPLLEDQVNKQLQDLSMEHATIKVHWEEKKQLNAYGIDDIEILFAPNKGSAYNSIKKVASGGESARLMLCMKSTVANAIHLPSMIFDEVDTGVSGDVAGKMGTMLGKLSKNHQLIVISHLPQVAAKGKKHFFVYKEIVDDITYSKMEVLDKEARIVEIAKMLSGKPPSSSAIANAKDLLKIK